MWNVICTSVFTVFRGLTYSKSGRAADHISVTSDFGIDSVHFLGVYSFSTTPPFPLSPSDGCEGGSASLTTMASADASAFLSAVKWGDEGYYLKEFTRKFKLPQVAKIIKGQYQNLGVPTIPSPALNQIVFLSSAGVKLKVAAQCVKFKDAGRRMIPVGSKLAVPEDYDGWFEILSEDGRAVRCIESVAELSRKSPRSCLVRDSIKVFLPRPEDQDSVWDKTRTVSAGEVLMVGREVSSPVTGGGNRAPRSCCKYLRCVTALGDVVYLSLEQRSRFSAIAGEDNISGVHSVRTLLSKRFPLMVRLVHGKPPIGVKSGSNFVPEMRLFSLVEEESLVAMPLLKDVGVIPLPTNAALKVLAPRNADMLIKLQEHTSLSNKCQSSLGEISDCIQVCDVESIREIKHLPPSPQYVYTRRHAPTAYRTIPLVKRSVSDPQGTHNTCRVYLERGLSTPSDPSPDTSRNRPELTESSDSDDYRYEEIDQIYDYVRGFAPLPETVKKELWSSTEKETKQASHLPQIAVVAPEGTVISLGKVSDRKPPEPPPIETIPARKEGAVANTRPHKITVSIVNRAPLKTKESTTYHHKLKKAGEEHIYEKIDKKCNNGLRTVKVFDNRVRLPLRSNSAGKICLQNGVSTNGYSKNNRCFPKGSTSHRHHPNSSNQVNRQNSKSRFLKSSTKSSFKDASLLDNKTSGKAGKLSRMSSKNNGDKNRIVTSPLFHIRYKSLTDLLLNSNSSPTAQDMSHSSTSSKRVDGSGASSSESSKEGDSLDPDGAQLDGDEGFPRNTASSRRLSRPKSLSNLIGDFAPRRRIVEHHNYYNLVQNDLIKVPELGNSKYPSVGDSTRCGKSNYVCSGQHRKLGTLYL